MISTEWYNGYEDGLKDSLLIRREVFINELGLNEKCESDDSDRDAMCIVLYDNGKAVGTGRILLTDGVFLFDRLAVLKPHRNDNLGNFILRLMIRRAFVCGGQTQIAYATERSKTLYERLGFISCNEERDFDNLKVFKMTRNGDITAACY